MIVNRIPIFLVFLFGILLGSTCLAAVSQSQEIKEPEELDARFLKADGKVLRNGSGQGDVVTLRGTNVGGWQVMEAWMCPTTAGDQKTAIETLTERFGKDKAEALIKEYEKSWWTEQDFDHVKELNFNVLRLPISYLNLLDEEGKLREDTLATYDWFVKECEEREIYVILDLHAAPGSQNGRDHSGDNSGSILFTDETSQMLTVSLWEQLAEHYKGNSTIAGYDLLNEPEGTEQERAPWGGVQLPFYDRLYQAIRAIDPDHLIILNSIWEPTNMPDPSKYGWENVMYEYHYYCWNGTDNATTQKNFTESKVTNNKKAGHNVPVLIGEFTLFDELQSWEHALKVYEENGWSWTTWTYKTVDNGNWGIYTSKSSKTPDANIGFDTAEAIEDKWSKLDTDTYFTKNKYLYDLLRTMANPELTDNNLRKWYQNVENEINLKAGRDAESSIVSSKETYSSREESNVIKLTVTGVESMPTPISRNVCISPAIRNSVDTAGMEYLIINTYGNQGSRALYITLVDKNGKTWSDYTSAAAMPQAHQWDKVFIDLTKAKNDIDLSAIIEVRIGANVPGSYYFDDIYFAQSYADPLPRETVEAMKKDMGTEGTILDWVDTEKSNQKGNVNRATILVLGAGVIVLAAATGFLFFFNKKNRAKRRKL
ncbi:MAG: glycoside hydrolase [Herbinix sp.]|nr:glycoside hydrolase [Herbinix sp.]